MKRVKLLFLAVLTVTFSSSCSSDDSTTTEDDSGTQQVNYLPVVVTEQIADIAYNSFKVGGRIPNDRGYSITEKGIVWSTIQNPTTDLETKEKVFGGGTSSFEINITNLEPNTKYYVRAYAINNKGTGYGNERVLTTIDTLIVSGNHLIDIEGNEYPTLIVNNKQWTAKNLVVKKYKNGDIIPQVQDPTQWANLTTGAWCYYNNDPNNEDIYGILYNFYAIVDSRGLAPEGWKIPKHSDWISLKKYLISAGYNASRLTYNDYDQLGKSMASQTHWLPGGSAPARISDRPHLNNRTGFNVFPSGSRNALGDFSGLGLNSNWWAHSSSSLTNTYIRHIDMVGILQYGFRDESSVLKNTGFSVRVLKE
jgi:uncharacterized protein (TIGR02145 family)